MCEPSPENFIETVNGRSLRKSTMYRRTRHRMMIALRIACLFIALYLLYFCFRFIRRDTCDLCNVHVFRPILRPPDGFCSPAENASKLLLLILVHSRPASFKKRNAIRLTWATLEMRQKHRFKILFVFGDARQHQREREDLHKALAEESDRFGDILQTDFEDSYANVTLKALCGLDFATRIVQDASPPTSSCGDAFHYVAKVDDDVFLNIDNAVKYLKEKQPRWRRFSKANSPKLGPNAASDHATIDGDDDDRERELFVGGQCDWQMPRRMPGDKWFVGPLEYPYISYPAYCHGFTIFYSMAAATKIYRASENVPFFRFDDVYLTGLIGTRHLGLTPTNIHGIFINNAPTSTCFRKNVMISEHGEGGEKLIADWNKVQKAHGCGRRDARDVT